MKRTIRYHLAGAKISVFMCSEPSMTRSVQVCNRLHFINFWLSSLLTIRHKFPTNDGLETNKGGDGQGEQDSTTRLHAELHTMLPLAGRRGERFR